MPHKSEVPDDPFGGGPKNPPSRSTLITFTRPTDSRVFTSSALCRSWACAPRPNAQLMRAHSPASPAPSPLRFVLQSFDAWSLAEGPYSTVHLRRWGDRDGLRILGP
jgi:hypothetical protein